MRCWFLRQSGITWLQLGGPGSLTSAQAGMSAGIIRRGERGGCCAVKLQPVESSRSGRPGVTEGPISSETRKAFIDLCRCARKEMSKQEGGPKRKRALLPCVGAMEQNGEGSLLQAPPSQPRRSQRQQQRFRKPADEEVCAMLHEASLRKDMDSSMGSHSEAEDSNTCSICMGDIVERTILEKCGHSFCRSCLEQAFKVKKACPVCRLVYGQLVGNQPAIGSMIVERDPDLELPGHEGHGCICIIYSFPPGIQTLDHTQTLVFDTQVQTVWPTSLTALKGTVCWACCVKAFEQRLIFTIGTSMTTGLQNVITWNDIHHKTSIFGGPRCFGYPDPTYLVRVTEELREKGITAD